MKYRQIQSTDLTVSEVGFGVWSVSMNWWGEVSEPDAIQLLRKAADLGITFFDTADTYGAGYGEEIVPKALADRRSEIVIGTKFGYDIEAPREGHRERPQRWDPEFVKRACESSLKRLQTDYIDLYQYHNARLDVIQREDTLGALEDLKAEGKIRHYAVAVGPDIGWREEGLYTIEERGMPAQLIYSILEQDPADVMIKAAESAGVGVYARVPHASGMLDGKYTKEQLADRDGGMADERQQLRRDFFKFLNDLDGETEYRFKLEAKQNPIRWTLVALDKALDRVMYAIFYDEKVAPYVAELEKAIDEAREVIGE